MYTNEFSRADICDPQYTRSMDVEFDLDETLTSVVAVHTLIPKQALTATALGTERAGHGVVISDDGLIVTIGYVITEAEQVWITDHNGHAVPGYVVGYDYESGFGLIRATQPLNLPAMPLGSTDELAIKQQVIVAGYGSEDSVVDARVIAKREFAGYWEYVLDEALFTAPPHTNWGGAAVINDAGQLCGIGSLLVQRVDEGGQLSGANMSIPIDLLNPILDDLCAFGRPATPPRPWMGFLVQDVGEDLVVSGVYQGCPADNAGLAPGDIITHIDGVQPANLADLFRRIWGVGDAGVQVPISVARVNEHHEVLVDSIDRNLLLKSGQLH